MGGCGGMNSQVLVKSENFWKTDVRVWSICMLQLIRRVIPMDCV